MPSIVCTSDQIFNFYNTDGSIKNHTNTTISIDNAVSKKHKLHTIGNPIIFNNRKTTIDPYLMGLWIGDGTTGAPQISSMDDKIIDYCKNYALQNNLGTSIMPYDRVNKPNKAFRITFTSNKQANYLARYLKDCSSPSKFIPDEYLYNSTDNRMKLLAGLIDTDGHYFSESKYFELTITSNTLCDQYLFLIKSLRIYCCS